MDQLRIRAKLLEVLAALKFDQFWRKHAPKGAIAITSESFDKLSPLQFRLLCYFLLAKLDRDQCVRRFRNVFPARDVQQEAEFRRIAIDWLNQLAVAPVPGQRTFGLIQKIPAVHYQRLSGPVFVEQLFHLAVHVLQRYSSRLPAPPGSLSLTDAEQYLATRHQHDQKWRAELAEYREKASDACRRYRDHNQTLEQQLAQMTEAERCAAVSGALADRLQKLDLRLRDWLRVGCPKPVVPGQPDTVPEQLSRALDQLERVAETVQPVPGTELLLALQHCHRLRQTETELAKKLAETDRQLVAGHDQMTELRRALLDSPYARQCVAEARHRLMPLFQLPQLMMITVPSCHSTDTKSLID